MMQFEDLDIWRLVQAGLTVASISVYPFIICLLYHIKHEMASNPTRFQIRKILLVTALVAQLCVLTFVRDQYVWNEEIPDHQSPDEFMCGLSRFLWYGVIEVSVYYLFVALLWEETEASLISTKQSNPKCVADIQQRFDDHFFYFSSTFKLYTFAIALITLLPLPDVAMPDVVSTHFVSGTDGLRCVMSNVANMVGVANKLLFLALSLHAAVRLKRTRNGLHLSDSGACFVLIPLCTLCHIFALCNEQWLTMLSLDWARAMGFSCTMVLTTAMVCNHLMMQAQAKQKIATGLRRASIVVRTSLLNTQSNKIEPENKGPETKQRFSVPELDVNAYDVVMIGQEHPHSDDADAAAKIQENVAVDHRCSGESEDDPLDELNGLNEQMKRDSVEIIKKINSPIDRQTADDALESDSVSA